MQIIVESFQSPLTENPILTYTRIYSKSIIFGGFVLPTCPVVCLGTGRERPPNLFQCTYTLPLVYEVCALFAPWFLPLLAFLENLDDLHTAPTTRRLPSCYGRAVGGIPTNSFLRLVIFCVFLFHPIYCLHPYFFSPSYIKQ